MFAEVYRERSQEAIYVIWSSLSLILKISRIYLSSTAHVSRNHLGLPNTESYHRIATNMLFKGALMEALQIGVSTITLN